MLEFNIKDVPFFYLSDEVPFLNGTLPQLSLAINGDYAKLLLLVLFGLYFIFYCIISGILFYHWNTYGMKTKKMFFVGVLFTVVSLFFFAVLFSVTFTL